MKRCTTRTTKRAGLALMVAVALASSAACDERSAERDAVLRVVEEGRTALLEGQANEACGLLTPRGRERALEYRVDFSQTPRGSLPLDDPRVPQTCEAIVTRKADEAGMPAATWDEALREAQFEVASISESAAQVSLRFPRPAVEVRIELKMTSDGWRIDDSNAVPSGQ